MDKPCMCGHVRDEHDHNECTVDGCFCVHFEEDTDAGDDTTGYVFD